MDAIIPTINRPYLIPDVVRPRRLSALLYEFRIPVMDWSVLRLQSAEVGVWNQICVLNRYRPHHLHRCYH